MSPEEFKEEMIHIDKTYSSVDEKHKLADNLLCEVLTSLGYGSGVNDFYEMDKWYA